MSAAYHVQPQEPFTFTRLEEWPKWARRFERFRSLSENDKTVQVSTLLYSMGDEADDILRSFTLSADDMKKYDVVKDKFDHHSVTSYSKGPKTGGGGISRLVRDSPLCSSGTLFLWGAT